MLEPGLLISKVRVPQLLDALQVILLPNGTVAGMVKEYAPLALVVVLIVELSDTVTPAKGSPPLFTTVPEIVFSPVVLHTEKFCTILYPL